MRIQRGFTLIELLVVIAIIGILATLVITQLSGAQSRARNSNAKSDISQAGKAVETWKTTNNTELVPNSSTADGATNLSTAANGTVTAAEGWTTLFNTASTGFPVRISKNPSVSHVYTYQTNAVTAGDADASFGTATATNYCVGTTVTTSTAAPDGAFFVMDGVSASKANGTTTITYDNAATPCA
ncbi:MAG TPA: prepilin-type N-terminal cleavage/methylation domain-containing protein [Verrucomicrobiae bacterium]|nr:prepilin-type N-terminal cleavage/methylation domain-containing protein [Verrucomicrobiae bacterium]